MAKGTAAPAPAPAPAAPPAAPPRTPEQEYARQWRLSQLRDGLVNARRSILSTEGRIAGIRRDTEGLGSHLATLIERRAGYVAELATIPDQTAGPGPDMAAHRRQDLWHAVAVLDGADGAVGTLCDDLRDHSLIPGTRQRIEETKLLLAEAERDLGQQRREIAIAEEKLRRLEAP